MTTKVEKCRESEQDYAAYLRSLARHFHKRSKQADKE